MMPTLVQMIKLLEFIFFAWLALTVLKKIGGMFLASYIQKHQNTGGQSQYRQAPDGKINIDQQGGSAAHASRRVDDNEGEYVDYKEIK